MIPGWYPDPFRQARLRWWDGWHWGEQTSGGPFRPPASGLRLGVGLAVGAGMVLGLFLAGFTQVSLLTGTTQVWLGVALAVGAAVAAVSVRPVDLWLKIVAPIVAAICIASAIYDEVQLQHKRDELTHVFDDLPGSSGGGSGNGPSLSHTAVESYIERTFATEGVVCNDGEDMPLDYKGEEYFCEADVPADSSDLGFYTVKITNTDGHYTVSQD